MGWYTPELDESFARHFDSLPGEAKSEIAVVLKGLERDPYFVPDGEYVTCCDRGEHFFACEHARGWGGWVLGWDVQYYPSSSREVWKVIVFLYRRPADEAGVELFVPRSAGG